MSAEDEKDTAKSDNVHKPSIHERLGNKSKAKKVASVNSKVSELEKKLLASQEQTQKLLDSLQRTMAEFDNFRKRTEKEKSNIYVNAVSDVVEKMLPVLDNLERALDTIEDKDSSYFKGIEMVVKQFVSIFNEFGVEPIEVDSGDDFDHQLHCAVAHIEDENFGENKIVDELEKGYKYKDKVIRYSKVRVAN